MEVSPDEIYVHDDKFLKEIIKNCEEFSSSPKSIVIQNFKINGSLLLKIFRTIVGVDLKDVSTMSEELLELRKKVKENESKEIKQIEDKTIPIEEKSDDKIK